MKPKLIIIAGPTASGKTACAVALARLAGGEVISADSMQVYRGMDVLSAMPTMEERGGIPHHLLGIADPSERFTAAAWRDLAAAAVTDILSRGRVPIVCGGTGLYINALTRPMSFSVEADEALHAELLARADRPGGRRALHRELASFDPDSAARLHENDVRRVVRAIEIYRLSGRTRSEQDRADAAREGDYDETLFALEWPRSVLYERIDRRVDGMLAAGLVDEVRALMADERRRPTAAQAIGYKEIAAALEGRMTMEEAVLCVKQASRNLAKRQLTWFRRDPRTVWIPAEGRSAGELAEEMLRRVNGGGE